MRILGIDPGLSGAVALLGDAFKFEEVLDMPTQLRGPKSEKQMVNVAELARIIRRLEPALAIVELVNGMSPPSKRPPCRVCKQTPKTMGAATLFNFGESAGAVRGVLGGLGIEVHYVTPMSWKTRAGLIGGRDKEASRTKAIQMWPMAPLGRKKDSGRAEAMLIARFGLVGDFFTTVTKPDTPRGREPEQEPFQIF